MIVNLILYLIRVSPLLAMQDAPIVTAPPCDPLIDDLDLSGSEITDFAPAKRSLVFLIIEPARNSGVTPRIINQPVGKASYFSRISAVSGSERGS
jgi:hypothetical protein